MKYAVQFNKSIVDFFKKRQDLVHEFLTLEA